MLLRDRYDPEVSEFDCSVFMLQETTAALLGQTAPPQLYFSCVSNMILMKTPGQDDRLMMKLDPTGLGFSVGPLKQNSNSLRSFDQQLADEVHGELGDPGEGLAAVVHVDLGHVQVCLLLVVSGERRLSRHQHVGDDADAPEQDKQKSQLDRRRRTDTQLFDSRFCRVWTSKHVNEAQTKRVRLQLQRVYCGSGSCRVASGPVLGAWTHHRSVAVVMGS